MLQALLLVLFHVAGTIPLWVPVAYACAAIVFCTAFQFLLASSWPDTRSDQNLTGIQMPVAAAIQLAFVLLAPEVAFMFLTILFIVFAFGALRLDTKEAAFAWIAMAAGLAAVLWHVGDEISIPNHTRFEVVLVWLNYTVVFGRYVFLGVCGTDSLGRYGGEEFLAVLSGTTPELALSLVERVRSCVASHDWSVIAPGLVVRVSAGLAGYRVGDTLTSLTGRADRAMYQAKNTGRDRVILGD